MVRMLDLLMVRCLCLLPEMIRLDVIMNPFVWVWHAIKGRVIAIWIVSAVVTVVVGVTLLLLWLLKRKKK